MNLVFHFVCLTALLGLQSPARAGDINPPPGPISSTMKTLNEVESRTVLLPASSGGVAAARAAGVIAISAPGSYVLGSDLLATTADAGIEIAASNVTLDLNGMVLDGANVGTDGIIVLGNQTNIAIFNGSLTRWTESGVDASTSINSQFRDLRIEDFGSASSADDGLNAGTGATVSRCSVYSGQNQVGNDDGIDMISGVLDHCNVEDIQGRGIHVRTSSIVTECSVSFVIAGGIVADETSTIRNCSVSWSLGGTGFGIGAIHVGNDCYVVGNTCSTSPVVGGSAIKVTGSGNRIERNNIIAHDILQFGAGISVAGTFNVILRNTVTGSGAHYDIGPNNSFGPIVTVTGIGDISILVGAAHPWANFSY